MLFNSLEFLLFLPIVFILYWLIFGKSLKFQNLLILISSYVFYGWWDYRFLALIFLSTVVDYTLGLKLDREKKTASRKFLLGLSVLFNLSLLGFFKYYNFFVDSWVDLLGSMGYEVQSTWTLNIVLPVGISFYTFQTMSYTIDIYRKQLKPTKDFISFASFVSFFPQLVAGPIERATNLLPQILNIRTFNYTQGLQGLRLILWGMFKKVVIADSLAPIVDDIFANYDQLGGGTLILGALYFSFQIYCDFSGYSDIAIGTSKLFGFELMSNFKFPYFSRNIGEFWRRWHVSLSTWFRDYLYIPLGGSKRGRGKSLRNIFVIFIVSGFWHGANWTFLVWGLIHSLLYVPSFLFKTNRKYTNAVVAEDTWFPSWKELLQISTTFFFVAISWIVFRSDSLSDSFLYIKNILLHMSLPTSDLEGLIYVFLLLLLDWIFRKDERHIFEFKNKNLRRLVYMLISLLVIFQFTVSKEKTFIYFQF